jgi:hypothetical protein
LRSLCDLVLLPDYHKDTLNILIYRFGVIVEKFCSNRMRDHEVPASAPDPTQQVAEDLTFFSPTRTTRAMSHKIKNFIEGNDEEDVSPPRRAQKRQLGEGEDEDEDEDFDEFSVSDNDADDGDYYDRGGGRKTKRTGVPKALEPPYPPVPRQAYENYDLSTHNVYEYYGL